MLLSSNKMYSSPENLHTQTLSSLKTLGTLIPRGATVQTSSTFDKQTTNNNKQKTHLCVNLVL